MEEKKVREAIKLLEICVAGCKDVIRRNPDDEELLLKAIEKKNHLETAIEALEKQLPKKPLMTEDKQFALCPCCNGRGLLDNQSYCDQCGQKIDWSEQSLG